MSESQPILQIYGLHALSSRGLHVRESARSWKLILPMSPELLSLVSGMCGRLASADAARLLGLLDRHARRNSELAQVCLEQTLREIGTRPRELVAQPPVECTLRSAEVVVSGN